MPLFQLRALPWKTGLAFSAAILTVSCSHLPQLSSHPISLALGSVAQAQTAAPSSWATVEQNLVTEHNRVRQNPQSYIPILEAHLASMDAQGNVANGCGRNCTLLSSEGRPAVEEAIRFLREQPAVGALTLSNGAAQAAKAHAQDQSDGTTGHAGSDGSQPHERLERFGVENAGSGENIAYGPTTAEKVMLNLIVDDGVANRGHRTNIFSPDWSMMGAGCGAHATYGAVCVMEYAKAPRGSASSDQQFSIVNNGTIDLLSLKIADADVLGETLAIGQSRNIPLSNGCTVDLTLQLGGNYLPLTWNDIDLCAATLTIDAQNGFKVQY
jgi:uncharacterized protein YkwD